MKKNLSKSILFLCALVLSFYDVKAQGITSVAYKQVEIIKIENIKSDVAIYPLNATQKTVTREFFDGLGRPVQTVVEKGSPLQKDIVQQMTYDQYGRQSYSYLPYVSASNDGSYQSSSTAQGSFYANGVSDKIADDSKPYQKSEYENSPMQRLLKAGGLGNGFQPDQKFKSINYRTNVAADLVRLWTQDGSSAATYPNASLSVTELIDENGNKTITFTDKSGRVILKKAQADQVINGVLQAYLETYYIYNDAGNVKFMVSPKAVAQMKAAGSWLLTAPILNDLAFSYIYDTRGRMVEKKIPGSAPVYIIYDALDRPILTQDGNLRNQKQWYYTKYDSKQRVMSEGIYTDEINISRVQMQNYLNTLDFNTIYFEERLPSGTNGYSNQVFPTAQIQALSYYYYDDYDLDNNGVQDYFYKPQNLNAEAVPNYNVRGYLTAVKKRVLNTENWITSINFFDKRGNTIQVLSNNLLLAAMDDAKTVVPDFTGKTVQVKTTKTISATSQTTVISSFQYDHLSRIKSIDDSYNGLAAIRIASYDYNELGQLVKKNLHGLTSSTYLQSVDYRYNIRGQMTSINNSTLTVDDRNGDSNDLFGMDILYESVDNSIGNTAIFNGQISAVKWQSKNPLNSTSKEKSYRFSYDKLFRLNSAGYVERTGGAAWTNSGAFDEKAISYDENGNILSLQRNAYISGAINTMDNLQYSYQGNQLSQVSDGGSATLGFKNITGSTAAYEYNETGSLKADPKKGLSIAYNVLNKTDKITITTSVGRYINYTYDATGILLRKQAYDNNSLQKTTDYIDGFVYENGILAYFGMAEGRVRNTGGTLKPEYMITDYQGNVRVSFEEQAGVAVVRQENSYYTFGMVMPGSTVPTQQNKNLYNGGSEWQNDFSDLPDYFSTFFRNYDPALGRFIAVDPQAESNAFFTPYHYALNNPVGFNDPLGDKEMGLQQIIETVGSYENGGTWNSSSGFMSFGSDLNAFEYGVTEMQDGRYTEDEFAKLYKSMAADFNRGGHNGGDAASEMLRGVDRKEIKYNEDWLIERQKEAAGKVGAASLGLQLSFSDASDNVDYRTLRSNLFLSHYIGPWNPKNNNGEWDYSKAPQNRADMYALIHDKKYDKLKITGAGGVFFNRKAISADYSLVASEFSLFFASPMNISISPTERFQGFIVGVAIGIAALPKTIVEGVVQAVKSMPTTTFPGL